MVNHSVAYPYVRSGQHAWGAFADQAEEHVVVRNGVRAQTPQADTAGHRQGHESARFDNLAQHGTPAGLAVDGGCWFAGRRRQPV